MANVVTQVLNQIKTETAAGLGPAWHELPHVLDLSKNDERRGKKGYGVKPLSAEPAQSTTNAVTLDHSFELVLMDTVPPTDDDAQAFVVIGTLFDQQDEIFKRMIRSKLSLPGSVMLISNPSLSEPEFINGRQFVAVRMQFSVRYRQII